MASLVQRWNRYWFAPAPAYNLCLIRLFLAAVLFLKLTGAWGLYRVYRLRAEFPRRNLFEVGEMLDAWRMPFPGFEWLPVPSAFWFARLEELLLLGSVLMAIGLCSRIVVPLVALLFDYLLLLSQWSYHHHVFCLAIALTILAFTPCGRHLSVDALLRDPARPLRPTSILPLRLLQTLVCLIYSFTFLAKLNGGWTSGEIFRIFEETGRLRGPFAELLTERVGYQTLGLATLAAEGVLALGFWFPRLRRLAIFVGIGLHLGIDMTMSVVTFSYQMMVLYIAFLRPEPAATAVVYDPACAHCGRLRRRFRVLDWLGRLRWSARGADRAPRLQPDPAADAHALHAVGPDGRVESGFAAWRRLLVSCPLTFVPGSLLFLPPVAAVAAHLGSPGRHRSLDAARDESRLGASLEA